MGTSVTSRVKSPEMRECASPALVETTQRDRTHSRKNGRARAESLSDKLLRHGALTLRGHLHSMQEPEIKVVKRSPVSTGQLKRLTRRTSPAYDTWSSSRGLSDLRPTKP